MKQSLSLTITFLTVFLALAGSSLASGNESIKLDLNHLPKEGNVIIASGTNYNGINLPGKMIDGTLYLHGSNAVGLTEEWQFDPEAKVETFVLKEEIPVKVHLGNDAGIVVGGKIVSIDEDTKKHMENGLFPVRQVYELAGFTVKYNSSDHSVTLSR